MMKPDWDAEYIKKRFGVEVGDFVEYFVLRGRRPHVSRQIGTVQTNPETRTPQIKPKHHPTKWVKFYNGMIKINKLQEVNSEQ